MIWHMRFCSTCTLFLFIVDLSVVLAQILPDLVITNVSVSKTFPDIMSTITVDITVRNQGSLRANAGVEVDLFFNRITQPNIENPNEVGDDYLPTLSHLDPGQEEVVRFFVYNDIPESWTMWASVDKAGLVSELGDYNNVFGDFFVDVTWNYQPTSGYGWPFQLQDEQHQINGVLNECRVDDLDGRYFHDGLDVQGNVSSPGVYSVTSGQIALLGDGTRTNDGIYVGQLGHIHMTDFYIAEDQEGDFISAGHYLGLYRFNLGHIHLNDGPRGNERNALRAGGIIPFTDNVKPTIENIKIYEDGFTDSSHEKYLTETIRGRIDFHVKAYDDISGPRGPAAPNPGVYKVGYKIDNGAFNYNFAFDSWLTSGNAQYVYNTALSNASSFWYIPTNNMTGNSYIDTNNLTEGWHDVTIRVEDINENYDEFSFSIHTGIKTDVIDHTENLLPTEYHLLQNFPNPFNPSTAIRFALPKRSLVTLAVFNEQGGLVRELVTEKPYEPGWGELVWDGANAAGLPVASGAYFYRLTAESLDNEKVFTETKKLLLVR